MKASLAFFSSLLFFAAITAAQTQPSAPSENTNNGQTEASLSANTVINAQLDSSVDAKKVKQGDAVKAHITEAVKSTDQRTILPKGTKLIGHVTRVSSRAKGDSESMLGIQFDKAQTKEGQEIPLGSLTIQAVAASANATSSFGPGPGPGSSTGASPGAPGAGSRGGQPGAGAPPTSNYPGAEPGPGEANAAGPLPSNSRGVYGLEGLGMGTNSGTGETVITSKGKNVHLDSGTRLLLAPQQQAPVGASNR